MERKITLAEDAIRAWNVVGDLVWRAASGLNRYIPLGVTLRAWVLPWFSAAYSRLFPRSRLYDEHLRIRGSGRWHPAVAEDEPPMPTGAPAGGPAPFDVFVFPIIDWYFRHQRPQHLAEQLARRGHRVFYFATTFVSPDQYRPQPQMIGERIGLVSLPCSDKPPTIYEDVLTHEQVESVVSGIEMLWLQHHVTASVSIVHHPFWWPVVDRLANNRTVYDCLDHHGGFSNTAVCMLDLEDSLIASAESRRDDLRTAE